MEKSMKDTHLLVLVLNLSGCLYLTTPSDLSLKLEDHGLRNDLRILREELD